MYNVTLIRKMFIQKTQSQVFNDINQIPALINSFSGVLILNRSTRFQLLHNHLITKMLCERTNTWSIVSKRKKPTSIVSKKI